MSLRPHSLILIALAIGLLSGPASAGDIHDAATTGDVDGLRRILEATPSDLHGTDKDDRTPLDCAAIAGHTDAVLFLLEQISVAEPGPNTPEKTLGEHAIDAAANAADQGHGELLRALFERGGLPPFSRNDNGTTLLMLAASSNHVKVCDLICSVLHHNGLKPEQKEDGRTALHYAAQYGAPDTARFLLDIGFPPDVPTQEGWTALDYAARNGFPDVVEVLVQRGGADVGAPTSVTVKDGKPTGGAYMPLHLAAVGGHVDCIVELLDANADIDETDLRRYTALNMAIVNKKPDAIAALLERGADPEIRDYESETAVINAARTGDPDTVRAVLAYDVDLAASNYQDLTAAAIAIGRENADVLRLLIEAGADPNTRCQGVSGLSFAISNGHVSLVRLLLDNGADPGRAANGGCPSLSEAARAGDLAVVKILIAHGADVREHAPVIEYGEVFDGWYYSPVRGAAHANNLPLLDYLLDQGAEADATGKNDVTALQLAARHGNLPMMRRLVERGARIDGAGRDTPLLAAIKNGHGHAVEFLLDHGANPDGIDRKTSRSLLCLAVVDGSADMTRHLLAAGADPGVQCADATPLIRAVYHGHADVVRVMIDHGVDLSDKGNGGRSVILNAVMSGNAAVVRSVIEAGLDPRALELRTSDGRTLLIRAALKSDRDVVDVLIAAGADVNATVSVDRVPIFDGSDVRPEERDRTALQIIESLMRDDERRRFYSVGRQDPLEPVAKLLRAHGAALINTTRSNRRFP